MNRLAVVSPVLLMAMSLVAGAQDAVQKELDRAAATYQSEKEAYRTGVVEAYEKREDAARKAADKKLLDLIKAERNAYENWHAIPTSIPPAVTKRRASSRTRMETAFNAAIKSYIRMKNDEGATAVEQQLKAFLCEDWPHLDLDKAKIQGDAIQMGKYSSVFTTREFSGPIEINAVARTEKDNIRLRATRGSCVIFNWEAQSGTMRVARPDGRDQSEGGSIAASIQHPLKPGSWYKIRWRLTEEGMQVFVNDQVAFSEERVYDLTTKARVEIRAENSLLEVRDFHVIPLTKD